MAARAGEIILTATRGFHQADFGCEIRVSRSVPTGEALMIAQQASDAYTECPACTCQFSDGFRRIPLKNQKTSERKARRFRVKPDIGLGVSSRVELRDYRR